MRRALFGILFAAAMVSGAASSPALAAATPDPSTARAAPCEDSRFCYWVGVGFTGAKYYMYTHDPGTCVYFSSARRSYANYGSLEGYFYSNNDCTGSARAVRADTESRDIGFGAWSFKHACVSCRTEKR